LDKQEVLEMFEYLLEFYPSMVFKEKTAEAWQSIIYFMRKEEVYKCLQEHIKESSFPPKVADIYRRWHGNMYPQSNHKAGD